MAIRKPQIKKPRACPVQLALLALEPTRNPLDMPMTGFDPTPTALDPDGVNETSACHYHHYVCADCGRPLHMSTS